MAKCGFHVKLWSSKGVFQLLAFNYAEVVYLSKTQFLHLSNDDILFITDGCNEDHMT